MPTFTYSAPDRQTGEITQGGYSQSIVVREEFVCRIPDELDFAHAAPLLCAGITTYSPLKRWGVKKGDKVAVAGLGGLGHMAVKLAKAMGAEVTVLTTSPEKGSAARENGASNVIISTDEEAMRSASARFNLLINTIPVTHELQPYVNLLRPNGTMVILGALEPLPGVNGFNLVFGNRAVAGSAIGGLPETQEMLNFCAAHGIVPDIEVIPGEKANDAWANSRTGRHPASLRDRRANLEQPLAVRLEPNIRRPPEAFLLLACGVDPLPSSIVKATGCGAKPYLVQYRIGGRGSPKPLRSSFHRKRSRATVESTSTLVLLIRPVGVLEPQKKQTPSNHLPARCAVESSSFAPSRPNRGHVGGSDESGPQRRCLSSRWAGFRSLEYREASCLFHQSQARSAPRFGTLRCRCRCDWAAFQPHYGWYVRERRQNHDRFRRTGTARGSSEGRIGAVDRCQCQDGCQHGRRDSRRSGSCRRRPPETSHAAWEWHCGSSKPLPSPAIARASPLPGRSS